MSKPQPESVTADPCVCGYLARFANDSKRPIVFDESDKRYKYRYTFGDRESLLVIYHCPWCGGVASDSHQKSLFFELNDDACSELEQKIRSCKSIDEVVAIFGEPDEDESTVIRFNEKPGVAPRSDRVRLVTFRQIHPEMSVSVTQQLDGFLSASFSPNKITSITDPSSLLKRMEPVLNDGTYVYVKSKGESGIDLTKIIASIREDEGTTLIVEESFAESQGLEPIFECAWITLYVNSDLTAIGFTAAFSAVLGKAGISCNVVAGINHDHIFVPIHQAALAMTELKALQEHHSRLLKEPRT